MCVQVETNYPRPRRETAQGIGILAEGKDSEDSFAAEDLVTALKERGINARAGRMGRVRIVLLRLNTKKAADILGEQDTVIAHANEAVDKVRRDEARSDRQAIREALAKSRWLWLKNPENLTRQEKRSAVCAQCHLAGSPLNPAGSPTTPG